MKYTAQTTGYFLMWGAFYGLALGGWSTTIMFPVVGTMFGLAWGAGVGVACGLLCGMIVSMIQAFTFHPDIDLPVYRMRLSLATGIIVGTSAPLFLSLSSQNVLWGNSSSPEFYIPSLVAAAFWGSLCGAYVGHGYPFWLAQTMMGKDRFAGPRLSIFTTANAIARADMVRVGLGLGGVSGLIIGVLDVTRHASVIDGGVLTRMLGIGALGGIAGIVAAFILMLLISLGVAALIVFLKRLLFSSDVLSTVSHFERLALTGAAGLFTGAICSWPLVAFRSAAYGSWIFPVFCALFVGFSVFRALPTDLDKTKRKEKNTLTLEEAHVAEGEMLATEDPLLEAAHR